MTRTTAVLVAGAVAITLLIESAIGPWGVVRLVDAVAGLVFLLLAIMTRTEARWFSLASALAGLVWLLSGVPALVWLHRPLLVWVAASFPDGHLRRRGAVAIVAASALIALPPLATSPLAMAGVGVGVAGFGAGELVRTRSWPSVATRARGWGASLLGAAFLVPLAIVVVNEVAGISLSASVVEIGYAGLIGASGLALLAAGSERDRVEAEAVIALAEDGGSEGILAELRQRVGHTTDPATRRAFETAIAMLERNVDGHRDLAAAVAQSRLSRRRLVNATVVERRVLRRKLSERAGWLLPEIDQSLGAVRTGDPTALDLLARSLAEVRGIGADLDVLADGLHPARLTEVGLGAVGEVLASSPVRVRVDLPGRRYAVEVEAAIWYACAEAVTNAIKHGNARWVEIVGRDSGTDLTVEIRDDGIGGAAPHGAGGLWGLADRLAALDGTLSLDSEPGHGTTVRVRVPVLP